MVVLRLTILDMTPPAVSIPNELKPARQGEDRQADPGEGKDCITQKRLTEEQRREAESL